MIVLGFCFVQYVCFGIDFYSRLLPIGIEVFSSHAFRTRGRARAFLLFSLSSTCGVRREATGPARGNKRPSMRLIVQERHLYFFPGIFLFSESLEQTLSSRSSRLASTRAGPSASVTGASKCAPSCPAGTGSGQVNANTNLLFTIFVVVVVVFCSWSEPPAFAFCSHLAEAGVQRVRPVARLRRDGLGGVAGQREPQASPQRRDAGRAEGRRDAALRAQLVLQYLAPDALGEVSMDPTPIPLRR